MSTSSCFEMLKIWLTNPHYYRFHLQKFEDPKLGTSVQSSMASVTFYVDFWYKHKPGVEGNPLLMVP